MGAKDDDEDTEVAAAEEETLPAPGIGPLMNKVLGFGYDGQRESSAGRGIEGVLDKLAAEEEAKGEAVAQQVRSELAEDAARRAEMQEIARKVAAEAAAARAASGEPEREIPVGPGPVTNLALGYGKDGTGDGNPERGLEGLIARILPDRSPEDAVEAESEPEKPPVAPAGPIEGAKPAPTSVGGLTNFALGINKEGRTEEGKGIDGLIEKVIKRDKDDD